ncbi:hypothetical protein NKG94_31655 [Micromonospora sp. M12]
MRAADPSADVRRPSRCPVPPTVPARRTSPALPGERRAVPERLAARRGRLGTDGRLAGGHRRAAGRVAVVAPILTVGVGWLLAIVVAPHVTLSRAGGWSPSSVT